MPSEANKRIAKNTMMLYIRTLLIMLVSLYTSRIILQALGETDFGIYTLVGGFVALLTFLNAAMTSATQRFLNFELGKKDNDAVGRIFSMSMSIYMLVALLFVLFFETIGLWFFANKLNIPPDRMQAAYWVYHFSILAICIQMLRVPYQASIIAYEDMSFYAYVSIAEVILRLGMVYLLLMINGDKLIVYAVLMFAIAFIVNLCYRFFCKRHYTTCNYRLFWDRSLFRSLLSFSGWSMLGGVANVGATHGVNIILNIFFGVTVNAAMGIANQVQTAIYSFVTNFQMAFNPQIVKTYAENETKTFTSLVFRASRLSYYLLFIIAFPAVLCCDSLLKIWLTQIPEYTLQFIQLYICVMLIDALSAPLWISIQAIGKIKRYQLSIAAIIFFNLPLVYVCGKLGWSPVWAIAIRIIVNFVAHMFRLWYLYKYIAFPSWMYIREIMGKCLLTTVLITPIPIVLYMHSSGMMQQFATAAVGFVMAGFITVRYGLEKNERDYILKWIRHKINKNGAST